MPSGSSSGSSSKRVLKYKQAFKGFGQSRDHRRNSLLAPQYMLVLYTAVHCCQHMLCKT